MINTDQLIVFKYTIGRSSMSLFNNNKVIIMHMTSVMFCLNIQIALYTVTMVTRSLLSQYFLHEVLP